MSEASSAAERDISDFRNGSTVQHQHGKPSARSLLETPRQSELQGCHIARMSYCIIDSLLAADPRADVAVYARVSSMSPS